MNKTIEQPSPPSPNRQGLQHRMEFHPASNRDRLMTAEEFHGLKADIKKNGVKIPVVTCDGMILDGRNRWLACEELGIDCPTIEYRGGDPSGENDSLNEHRRHMDEDDKFNRAAKAIKKNPNQSDRAIAKEIGVSAPTVGKARRTVNGFTVEPHPRIGLDGKKRKPPKKQPPAPTEDELLATSENIISKSTNPKSAADKTADSKKRNASRQLAEEMESHRTAYMLRGSTAIQLAKVKFLGKVTPEIIDFARRVAEAWDNRADRLSELVQRDGTDQPRIEPTDRQRDNAYNYAQDAINCLRKIGKDNPLRAEAFNTVKKWMKDSQ